MRLLKTNAGYINPSPMAKTDKLTICYFISNFDTFVYSEAAFWREICLQRLKVRIKTT